MIPLIPITLVWWRPTPSRAILSSPPPKGRLLEEPFNAFDATQWPGRVITGTQDSTIPLAFTNEMLQIGALKDSPTGTHYYGISSAAYNLSNNGCASVQLVKSPNPATTAFTILSTFPFEDESDYEPQPLSFCCSRPDCRGRDQSQRLLDTL